MTAKAWQILALIIIVASPARAQLWDVAITADRKKVDEQRSRGDASLIVTKEVLFKIAVESRTSKPLTDLAVKYMVFYADSQPGSTGKALVAFHKGSTPLASLAVHETASVDTESFKLTTEELDGNYIYTSGASSRSQDRVLGIWVKVFAAGKLVGEYSNPPLLAKKNSWKE